MPRSSSPLPAGTVSCATASYATSGTTRARLTVAEASRPAEVKLMPVPGRVPARSAQRSLPGQDGRIAASVSPAKVTDG
jgi:hypothetical protein